jgi:hypothetical protein
MTPGSVVDFLSASANNARPLPQSRLSESAADILQNARGKHRGSGPDDGSILKEEFLVKLW